MVNFLLCFWEIFFNLLLGNFAFFASCCVLYCKVLCSFSVFFFFFSISSTECFIGITPEASFPFHRPHMFDTNRWRGAAGRGPCFFPNFPLILPIPLLCLDHGRSLVILSGRSFVCTAFGNSHFIYATCCPETCCQKSCESLSLTTSTNGDASLSLSLSLSRLANSIFHLCLHGRPFIFWFVFWLLRALRAQVFTNELLSCLLHFFAGPQVFPAPVFVFSRFSLGRQPHQMTRVSCASGCFRACWLQNVSIEWPDFEVRSHHMPAAKSAIDPAHLHAFEIERRCRLQKSKKKRFPCARNLKVILKFKYRQIAAGQGNYNRFGKVAKSESQKSEIVEIEGL